MAKKLIGSYVVAMGGVDVIVFTGGIGENDYLTRQNSCKDLDYIGGLTLIPKKIKI